MVDSRFIGRFQCRKLLTMNMLSNIITISPQPENKHFAFLQISGLVAKYLAELRLLRFHHLRTRGRKRGTWNRPARKRQTRTRMHSLTDGRGACMYIKRDVFLSQVPKVSERDGSSGQRMKGATRLWHRWATKMTARDRSPIVFVR